MINYKSIALPKVIHPKTLTTFISNSRFGSYFEEWEEQAILYYLNKQLQSGSNILDIMAGARSYIPQTRKYNEVIGVGLNENELSANLTLTSYQIININDIRALPKTWENHFNVAIMTAGMAYITNPNQFFELFSQALVQNGTFFIAFNDKYFEQEATPEWIRNSQNERIQLTIDAINKSNKYQPPKHVRHYYRPSGLMQVDERKCIDILVTKRL